MTRCKFICDYVTNHKDVSSIRFYPVIDGSEENKKFYKWTPGGEVKLDVVNPEVAKQFEPGKEYYIDISPAE